MHVLTAKKVGRVLRHLHGNRIKTIKTLCNVYEIEFRTYKKHVKKFVKEKHGVVGYRKNKRYYLHLKEKYKVIVEKLKYLDKSELEFINLFYLGKGL